MVDPMSDKTKEILRRHGRQDLIDTNELVASGYAGTDTAGRIVDVRINPTAVPLAYDNYFQVPEKPKKK